MYVYQARKIKFWGNFMPFIPYIILTVKYMYQQVHIRG